jgi:hypothetical protein
MKLGSIICVLLACACGSSHDFQSDDDAGGSTDDGGATTTKNDAGSSTKNDAGSSSSNDASTTTGQPSLEIVSGNGGTVPSGWPTTDPLRVRARDAQKNPVANAQIAFAVGAGQSLHLQDYDAQFIATDADGIAAVTYNAFPIDQNKGDEIDTVTATWNSLSVAFTVIITQVPSGAWAAPPLFDMKVPDTSPELGELKAGTTVPAAVQGIAVFQQGPLYGQGVPSWGFRITDSSDLLTASPVSCVGGTALADAQGNMSCDLVVPQTPGDYYFQMLAAGTIKWSGHLKAVP